MAKYRMTKLMTGALVLCMAIIVAAPVFSGGKGESSAAGSKITFLTLDAVNFRGQLETFISEFQQVNPGVTIEADFNGDPGTTFVTAIESGTAPDITFLWSGALIPYVQQKRLAQVPEAFESKLKANIYDYALIPVSNDGKLYGIPYNFYPSFGEIMYNKDIISKSGIDPSTAKTWDELMQMAQKMTLRDASGKITQAGFSAERDADSYFMSWVLQAGGKIFNDDGTAAFDNAIGRAALQRYADIFLKWKVDSADFGKTTDEFKKGTVAMTNGMPWFASILAKDTPNLPFDFFRTPTINGADPLWPLFEVWMFSVSQKAANNNTVWQFLEFLTDPERSARWSQFSGEIAAVKGATKFPQLSESAFLKPFLPLMPYGRSKNVLKWLSSDVTDVLRTTMPQSVIFGQATVDEAIKAAVAEINRINKM